MKNCKQCKFYNSKLEFDCIKFNMVILDFNNASKCRYYKKRKGRRKRCKNCMYLEYKYLSDRKKAMYICSMFGKPRAYNQLIHCDKYKKLNNGLSFSHVKQTKTC